MHGIWNKISRSLSNASPRLANRQLAPDTCRYLDLTYDKMLIKICDKMVRSSDYKIAWKRGSTLHNNLWNAKDPTPDSRKSGVYEIPLFNKDERCLQFCIGSTARNISKRINEHKADITAGRLATALASKFYESDIYIQWGDATVIKTVYDGRGLTTLEAIEMIKRSSSKKLINDNTPDDLPPSWLWAAANRI